MGLAHGDMLGSTTPVLSISVTSVCTISARLGSNLRGACLMGGLCPVGMLCSVTVVNPRSNDDVAQTSLCESTGFGENDQIFHSDNNPL